MLELIEAKVAEILNARELIINRGSKHGVKIGAKFEVIENKEILDPDTKENLGSVKRVKVRVNIVHVAPLFSIGQTYETYQAPGGDLGRVTGTFGAYSFPSIIVKTLRTSQIPGDAGIPVNIGDKVIQMDEGEQ